MSDPHHLEVAAHHALVRHVAAQSATVDTLPAVVERGLAVVEGWLDGEPVSLHDLETAQRAAQAERQTLQYGARRWMGELCSAVGHLCWMARGERTWRSAAQPLLTACVSTRSVRLPSRERAGATTAIFDELRAYLDAARLRLRDAPASDVPPATAPDDGPLPDVTEFIGAVAIGWLQERDAGVDPRLRRARSETEALLVEHGLTVHDAALAFDRRYGGIVVPEGPVIGVAAVVLRVDATYWRTHGVDEAAGLVPVGAAGDIIWFLDREGRGWIHDLMSGLPPRVTAISGDVLLSRQLLFDKSFACRLRGEVVDMDGHRGAQVAATMNLPVIPEATDKHARFWGDETTLVAELSIPDEGDVTFVAGARAAIVAP